MITMMIFRLSAALLIITNAATCAAQTVSSEVVEENLRKSCLIVEEVLATPEVCDDEWQCDDNDPSKVTVCFPNPYTSLTWSSCERQDSMLRWIFPNTCGCCPGTEGCSLTDVTQVETVDQLPTVSPSSKPSKSPKADKDKDDKEDTDRFDEMYSHTPSRVPTLEPELNSEEETATDWPTTAPSIAPTKKKKGDKEDKDNFDKIYSDSPSSVPSQEPKLHSEEETFTDKPTTTAPSIAPTKTYLKGAKSSSPSSAPSRVPTLESKLNLEEAVTSLPSTVPSMSPTHKNLKGGKSEKGGNGDEMSQKSFDDSSEEKSSDDSSDDSPQMQSETDGSTSPTPPPKRQISLPDALVFEESSAHATMRTTTLTNLDTFMAVIAATVVLRWQFVV